MNNTNTIDKDAMRKQFELKFNIDGLVISEHTIDGSKTYVPKDRNCQVGWRQADTRNKQFIAYQAAYESCLSEFEPVAVYSSRRLTPEKTNEFYGYLLGETLPDKTPLFTRKG